MISFHEARARLLADVRRVGTERLGLRDAAGRILAETLEAPIPLPPFDNSAMDGYAVATTDLAGDGPWSLRVVGESSAGRSAPGFAEGTACRIFTGAPVPVRADAVIMQENVAREGDVVRFEARPKAGQHIRRAGEDLARGAVAISSGARLRAGALALAAMIEQAELVVARRPRVTIICTGDELRPPGSARGDASIAESNSPALAALAEQAGAEVRVAPMARDEPAETQGAIREGLEGSDLLLTVGGVSVGDHDVVRPALDRAGVTLDFWRVAIKPGKPIAMGRTAAGAYVLGLPGNPASAIVTFAVFGAPLLRAMQGDARPLPLALPGRLARPHAKRSPDRLELARATLTVEGGALVVHLLGNQSSGAATSLASSDGLAMIPPGEGGLEAGTPVDFVRWGDF